MLNFDLPILYKEANIYLICREKTFSGFWLHICVAAD